VEEEERGNLPARDSIRHEPASQADLPQHRGTLIHRGLALATDDIGERGCRRSEGAATRCWGRPALQRGGFKEKPFEDLLARCFQRARAKRGRRWCSEEEGPAVDSAAGGRRGDDLGQRSGEGERDMSLAPILHKLPF
jgi:hypothetical protein